MGQTCHHQNVLGTCFRNTGSNTQNSEIENEFDELCKETTTWIQRRKSGKHKELPDKWYNLIDKVRSHVAQRGGEHCTMDGIHMLHNILEESPFPPLRTDFHELKRAFRNHLRTMLLLQETPTATHRSVPYRECTIPQLLDRMNDPFHDSPGLQRFQEYTDNATRNMRMVWGPFCSGMEDTPSLVFNGIMSVHQIPLQWNKLLLPEVTKQVEKCSSAGRSHVILFLHWRWYIKDPDESGTSTGEDLLMGHLTLLYFDTHRRIQGFFDPNGGDFDVLGEKEKVRVNRYDLMAPLLLPGYRRECIRPRAVGSWLQGCPRFRPVQTIFESNAPMEEQGYCSSICLLLYVLAHRFDYFDIPDAAFVLRSVVQDMQTQDIQTQGDQLQRFRRRLSQWQWILCNLDGATQFEQICIQLGVFWKDHNNIENTCAVVRANGSMCTTKYCFPFCYCKDHLRLVGVYNQTIETLQMLSCRKRAEIVIANSWATCLFPSTPRVMDDGPASKKPKLTGPTTDAETWIRSLCKY